MSVSSKRERRLLRRLWRLRSALATGRTYPFAMTFWEFKATIPWRPKVQRTFPRSGPEDYGGGVNR